MKKLRWQVPSRLRTRLLAVALVIAVPALGYVLLEAMERRAAAIAQAERDALSFTHLLGARKDEVVRLSSQLLFGLSSMPEMRDTRSPANCNRVATAIHTLHPRLSNIGSFLPSGDVFCSAMEIRDALGIAERPHFRRAVATRGLTIGDVLASRRDGGVMLPIVHPIQDENGSLLAIAFVTLSLDWLQEAMQEATFPPGTTLSLVDRDGSILARYPRQDVVGRKFPYAPAALAALQSGSTSGIRAIEPDGVERMFVFAPFHTGTSGNAYLSVGVPLQEVLAAPNRVFMRTFAVQAMLILALCAAVWLAGVRLVLRPIEALTRAAERLRKGELSVRARLPAAPGDFANLAQSFDAMAEEIELRDTKLRRVNRTLRVVSGSNRALLRAQTEEALLQDMCRIAVDIGGYALAWVGAVELDDGKTIRPIAQYGIEDSFIAELNATWDDAAAANNPAGVAVRTGRFCAARDIPGDGSFEPLRCAAARHGIRSVIALPLHAEKRVSGVLMLCALEPDAFSDEEIELLSELAGDLAYGLNALDLSRKHEHAENTIRRLAYEDSLTGLANRNQLFQRMEKAIEEAATKTESVVLIVANVDRFHDFQDSLGPHNADRMLELLARRLVPVVGDAGLLARLEVDEFAVLAPGINAEQAITIAKKMRQSINEPLEIAGVPLDIQASVGIAVHPGHARDAASLYQRAERAVIDAKRERSGYAFASAGDHDAAPKRLAMIRQLRDAIDNNELTLHYQPEIDLESGVICGAEALVRWRHPSLGLIFPNEFVTLAEHTGLIKPLTYWVLEAAVRQCFAWREQRLDLPVAVNLSEHNLRDPELPARVQRLLSTWGVRPEQLRIEVTETTLMEDVERSMKVLTALRAMGLQIYIDDFGTGYSSLGSLAVLPLDFLKIDRSFVERMGSSPQHMTLVSTIIGMAHSLHLKVIAEGVETPRQLELLRGLGCDEVQGFYFSPPLAPDKYRELVESGGLAMQDL